MSCVCYLYVGDVANWTAKLIMHILIPECNMGYFIAIQMTHFEEISAGHQHSTDKINESSCYHHDLY